MLIFNESKFGNFNGDDGRAFVNAFVYLLSDNLELQESGNMLVGTQKLLELRPSKDLLERYKKCEIKKGEFKKAYFKELKQEEQEFLLYTIVRSITEKHYIPMFITSDEDWETGFPQILAKFIKKRFGLKLLNAKKYSKELKALYKEAKAEHGKGKARRKAYKKMVRSFIKDNVQLSMDGLERLEKMEKKFALTRIIILLNQSDDAADEISKKAIIKAINLYASSNKSTAKHVKRAVKELGISKKSDRWSRRDAIMLAQAANDIAENSANTNK